MSDAPPTDKKASEIKAVLSLLDTGGYVSSLRRKLSRIGNPGTVEKDIQTAISEVIHGADGVPFEELTSESYERSDIHRLVARKLEKKYGPDMFDDHARPSFKGPSRW